MTSPSTTRRNFLTAVGHAYYVDYRNKKALYIAAFLDHVAWDVVAARFQRAAK